MERRQQLIKELRTVMVENLELKLPEQLQESDRLYEDLYVDSIMVIQLMVYIEEVFHVSVPEDGLDPKTFFSVGSVVDLIESLQQAKAFDEV